MWQMSVKFDSRAFFTKLDVRANDKRVLRLTWIEYVTRQANRQNLCTYYMFFLEVPVIYKLRKITK
jgi:hypothetical protein